MEEQIKNIVIGKRIYVVDCNIIEDIKNDLRNLKEFNKESVNLILDSKKEMIRDKSVRNWKAYLIEELAENRKIKVYVNNSKKEIVDAIIQFCTENYLTMELISAKQTTTKNTKTNQIIDCWEYYIKAPPNIPNKQ